MVKIYEFECKKCGRVIRSLHKGQFEHNKAKHIQKHKNQEGKI